MAERGVRSVAATIVGWLIAAVVLVFFFGAIFATIRVVIRLAAIFVVVGGLLWLYFRLRGDDDT